MGVGDGFPINIRVFRVRVSVCSVCGDLVCVGERVGELLLLLVIFAV